MPSQSELEEAISDLGRKEQVLRDRGHSFFGGNRQLVAKQQEDGNLGKHELSRELQSTRQNGNGFVNTEELVRTLTNSVHAAYDYTIEQLDTLINEAQSDKQQMIAKRDAANFAFAEFINCATSVVTKIEPKKQTLTKLVSSSPL